MENRDSKIEDFSEKLLEILPERIKQIMEKKVSSIIGADYEVKYVQVLYRGNEEEKALKLLVDKLEKVYEKYGIVGSLFPCLCLNLAGPEVAVAPLSLDWDYKANPVGPGTLGWEKTEEEIEKLTNRKLLVSYPAIPRDELFHQFGWYR